MLTTCELNAMEEGEDALDLAALATAFRASNEVGTYSTTQHSTDHPQGPSSSLPPPSISLPTHPPLPPSWAPLPHFPPQVFRAILKSEVLREAISDLSDLPGASTVRVHVSPHDPHFHLASGGTFGSLDLFLPKTSEVRAG